MGWDGMGLDVMGSYTLRASSQNTAQTKGAAGGGACPYFLAFHLCSQAVSSV